MQQMCQKQKECDPGYSKELAHTVVQIKILLKILSKVTYATSADLKPPLPIKVTVHLFKEHIRQYQKLRYFDAAVTKILILFFNYAK